MHLYLTVPALESLHPHNRLIVHQANLSHTHTTLCRCSWTSHPTTVCVQAPIPLLDQVFWYLMVQWLIWILVFAAWMSLLMAIWTKCPYRMPSQAKNKMKKTCPTYNEKSENGSVHDSSWYGCMAQVGTGAWKKVRGDSSAIHSIRILTTGTSCDAGRQVYCC